MTGRFGLRSTKKPNEFGEYCVYLQYSTMSVPVRKSMDIWVHPDHWLGDDGRTTKFIKTGRDGNPRGDLLNKRLLNIKRGYDKIIDELLVDKSCKMTVPLLRSILKGHTRRSWRVSRGRFHLWILSLNSTMNSTKGVKSVSLSGRMSSAIWETSPSTSNKSSTGTPQSEMSSVAMN